MIDQPRLALTIGQGCAFSDVSCMGHSLGMAVGATPFDFFCITNG